MRELGNLLLSIMIDRQRNMYFLTVLKGWFSNRAKNYERFYNLNQIGTVLRKRMIKFRKMAVAVVCLCVCVCVCLYI